MGEWDPPIARLGAVVALSLACLACVACLARSAAAATFDEAAEGSGGVYFITDEALVGTDTDSSKDVYRRADGVLSIESLGASACQPACGNGASDVQSSVGLPLIEPEGVIFATAESLVEADTDSSVDIYERDGSGLTQVSTGQNGFNGAFDAEFFKASPDGSAVVFKTAEQLRSADTDSSTDAYLWDEGATSLVSQGSKPFNGAFDATPVAFSEDAGSVFFTTAEKLVEADSDESVDLYRRSGGTTSLISRGNNEFNGPHDVIGPYFVSADGARAMFATVDRLGAVDTDNQPDIYNRLDTPEEQVTTLYSQGPIGHEFNHENPSVLRASNAAANLAVWTSDEKIDQAFDEDTNPDVYERFGGATKFLSTSPPPRNISSPVTYAGFAPVGNVGFFITDQKMLEVDTDSFPDLYERDAPSETTRLVSRGQGAFNGNFTPAFQYASDDGSRVFFTTLEHLATEDTDGSVDLYERSGAAVTRLISAGRINGNGAFDVTPMGGLGRVLFTTSEQLVAGDTDSQPDLYAEREGETSLVSTGTPDPTAPTLSDTSPASPANVNAPAVQGTALAGTEVALFTNALCAGLPKLTGSAAILGGAGIPISVGNDTSTTIYADATDENGNTSPCSAGLTYVEDSTATPPTLSGVLPAGPANDNSPRLTGSAEVGSTVRIFGDPLCSGSPLVTTTEAELAGPGVVVPVPDDSTTRFFATIDDVAGNTSLCSEASPAYVEDSRAPVTTISGGPKKKTHEKRSVFQLGADEAATFECKVDNRGFAPCSSPYKTPGLRFGKSHRLMVKATDLAGNLEQTPATRVFRVLKKPPKRHR